MNFIKKSLVIFLLIGIICTSEQLIASVETNIDSPEAAKKQSIYNFYDPSTKQNNRLIHTFDLSGNTISKTMIDSDGKQTTLNGDELIALHEAGHAVVYVRKPSVLVIDSVNTISTGALQGANYLTQTYFIDRNIHELENQIITSLAGGVSEQVALHLPKFNNDEDIARYFSDPMYYSKDFNESGKDLNEVFRVFQQKKSLSQSESQKNLLELYQETYRFIVENQSDIKKIAHELLAKKTILKHDLYALLEEEAPLMSFEEGPFNLKHINNYELRNRAQKMSFNQSIGLDPRRYAQETLTDGTIIKTEYFLNGNRATEIRINPDGTKVTTQFNTNGNPVVIEYPNKHTISFTYNSKDNKIASTEKIPGKRLITKFFDNEEGLETIQDYDVATKFLSTSEYPIIEPSVLGEPLMERHGNIKPWASKGIELSSKQATV